MAHRLIPIGSFLLLLLASFSAQGQSVSSDPTRPPASVFSEAPEVDGGAPVLQSVIIPKKGKPIAVIGGQQVRLGEMYGENRLLKLTEREAVLDGPGGLMHLQLTPGIEKTDIKTKSMTKTPGAKRAQSGSTP
jgi:MSHA biogenesis protein MshK